MRLRFMPGRWLLRLLTVAGLATAIALFARVPLPLVATAAALFSFALLAFAALDWGLSRRAWRDAQVQLVRRLPSAFAIGVRQPVHLQFTSAGPRALRISVFDHCDASLEVRGFFEIVSRSRPATV